MTGAEQFAGFADMITTRSPTGQLRRFGSQEIERFGRDSNYKLRKHHKIFLDLKQLKSLIQKFAVAVCTCILQIIHVH